MESRKKFSKQKIISSFLQRDLMSVISFYTILFFIIIASFSSIIANGYPILILENKTSHKLPTSPLFISLFNENPQYHEEQYKDWVKNKKIKSVYSLIPYSPYEKNLDKILMPPSFSRFGNIMGTDELGRDIAARMVHGAKNSMLIGLVAVGISLFFGIVVGSLAGYFGGWVDAILSRLIEIVIVFPTLILIMAVLAIMKPSLLNIMIVIGLTGWTSTARVIRGEFLKRKNFDYVLASRIFGASHLRLIITHILPNAMAPVIVMAAFGVASAVLFESALSFLGIGVQPPEPSWGQILNASQTYMDFAWWMTFFPGFFIFLVVLSYNIIGDNIRKSFNL